MTTAAQAPAEPEDKRVACPLCNGSTWSRSGRGRCTLCMGSRIVEPARAEAAAGGAPAPMFPELDAQIYASAMPDVGIEPTVVHREVKPPNIGRAVLVAQRDVRARGGALRTSQMADGSMFSNAEEIVSLGGDTLLALGVAASVDHVEVVMQPEGESVVRRLLVHCRLEHPESGEVWERVCSVAVERDLEHSLSQSENAATTNAFAYFLVRTLAMPRGYRGEEAASKERGGDQGAPVLQKAKHDPDADVVTVLLADVAAAKTVAALTAVDAQFRRAIKDKRIRREADQKKVGEAIAERGLVVRANDAARHAEKGQAT